MKLSSQTLPFSEDDRPHKHELQGMQLCLCVHWGDEGPYDR